MASATPVHINDHENVKYREWETSQPNSPTTESTTSVTMRTGRSNEYRPLNISEDPNDRKGRIGGINRKALLSFLVIVVVVVTIITLTVVFVGYSGRYFSVLFILLFSGFCVSTMWHRRKVAKSYNQTTVIGKSDQQFFTGLTSKHCSLWKASSLF